jgi:single-stranded DNA-binding protein
MTGVSILASGRLHGVPDRRTSKNGNSYTSAKLIVEQDGDAPALWINLVAFGETGESMSGLAAGTTVSVTGKAGFATYEAKDGSHKVSANLTVNGFLTLAARPEASSGQGGSRAPKSFSGAKGSASSGGNRQFFDDPLDDVGRPEIRG